MDAWTAQQLVEFAGRPRQDYVDALVNGWPLIQRAQINTPLRLCEWLAQVAHETGGFTILAENTNWSLSRACDLWPDRFSGATGAANKARFAACSSPQDKANLIYGSGGLAKALGNVESGDGWDYRGRGLDQLTGRDSYRAAARLIGTDLEEHPELLEQPAISLQVSLARWQQMGLNRFADWHYTRAIGNAINRGNAFSRHDPIGATSRLAWFERAWAVFGDGAAPSLPQGLAMGAFGSRVEALQNRLRELGYPVGSVDRVFGPTLARAIASFKMDHRRRSGGDLEPDEVVGPLTQAALDAGQPVEVSAERQAATEKDLAKAGSTEIKAGQHAEAAGTMVTAVGVAEGARQAGLLEQMQQTVGWVPSAHTFMVPVIDAVQWGLKHAVWVIAIVGGVWVWSKARSMKAARLLAHVRGINLWR